MVFIDRLIAWLWGVHLLLILPMAVIFYLIIKDNFPLNSRYMDAIICIIKRDGLDTKFCEINHIHSSLSFTVEVEKDGRLPF